MAVEQECLPYMVISNTALIQMSRLRPKTIEDLKSFSYDGFIDSKVQKFGQKFVDFIYQYCEENPPPKSDDSGCTMEANTNFAVCDLKDTSISTVMSMNTTTSSEKNKFKFKRNDSDLNDSGYSVWSSQDDKKKFNFTSNLKEDIEIIDDSPVKKLPPKRTIPETKTHQYSQIKNQNVDLNTTGTMRFKNAFKFKRFGNSVGGTKFTESTSKPKAFNADSYIIENVECSNKRALPSSDLKEISKTEATKSKRSINFSRLMDPKKKRTTSNEEVVKNISSSTPVDKNESPSQINISSFKFKKLTNTETKKSVTGSNTITNYFSVKPPESTPTITPPSSQKFNLKCFSSPSNENASKDRRVLSPSFEKATSELEPVVKRLKLPTTVVELNAGLNISNSTPPVRNRFVFKRKD